ncbi:diguanylate cyclase (GGDEF) domain-containing protein [Mariprofundus aestuarium]|uniref:diguanylate cyclase n=1 Tax=Mariprofundus aestuarium TaxID=1921086 RepID=A0A2K8KVS3_MARES|nr:diguanylate cyclase [Mariprofundus aestuarium]ATX78920.1 diguanylate cyclase (GGDEF) domain-containing protein [Mariprofundus aestuarium]
MTSNKPREEIESISPQGETSIWKGFVFNISAVILLFILGIFLGVQLNNETLINNELLTRAKSDFENIIATRKWNTQHSGVYVEKVSGVESNPYLTDPDITATNGKVYTKKNPALMTREISELLSESLGHSFRITSLNPLNPSNRPDEFEADALRSFEKGEKELVTVEQSDGKSLYRYMAPLFVENSCLSCHAKQGYRVGDVRGGISVQFDISDVVKRLKRNRYTVWALSLAISILLIVIIYTFVRRIRRSLEAANATIRKLAITDELTMLNNRRYFMKRLGEEFSRAKRYGRPISCIMLDIDFFKQVNDEHGHLEGDHVLRSIARLMEAQERNTDVVARYGGEEFVFMLPETELNEALQVAERLRKSIEASSVSLSDGTVLNLTVSLGVCSWGSEQMAATDDFHALIKEADEALYRAKENGRNRVEATGAA